jgi:hypothetical protein
MDTLGTVLQATSNVIELQPGKKYILAFQSEQMTQNDIRLLQEMMHLKGINGIAILLSRDDVMQVVEVANG